MKSLKQEFLSFFEGKGHVVLKSASIIPENDPTVLFITAGMQPLISYLKGEKHPLGNRLVDVQKCFRTNDLDSVGDSYHHTFFEMLGNWSLGDYFKKDSIHWSFEFLTKKLSIPVDKLAVTVFQGNNIVSRDQESADLWKALGIKEERIAYLKEEDNWWPNIEMLGPCGPDTEIFYFRSDEPTPIVFDPSDKRWVEIWNNVFMQYNHVDEKTFIPLKHQNVDTGMGVERTTAILEHVHDNYQSSIFKDVIQKIEELSGLNYDDMDYQRSMRIVADHIRAIVMISGDHAQIKPSNTDQGYVLRRLIRRMIRHARNLNIDLNSNWDCILADMFIQKYQDTYPELIGNRKFIVDILKTEKNKFLRTLDKGMKEFEKVGSMMEGTTISAEFAFKLYDTYGFPLELTVELAKERNINVDEQGFALKFKEHQEKSRVGAEQKFKGGLASTGDMETKYHTATHLLNAALKKVLNKDVHQRGSNITAERMRFDFNYDYKMTPEQMKLTEDLVNEYISRDILVERKEISKEEALRMGAEGMFIEKYGDIVTIYTIKDVSMEFCGGPHVNRTGELGIFKIIKEEASSAGIRRIKAILE